MPDSIYMLFLQKWKTPKLRYGDYDKIRKEAEAVAKDYPGDTVYIARVQESVRIQLDYEIKHY